MINQNVHANKADENLKKLSGFLPNEITENIDAFSELLALTWTSVERVDKSLLPLFKKCNKEKLMDKDEFKAYQELPESITIYRGVSEINKRRIKGLSWTTDYEVARMFAGRYLGYSIGGTFYQATIEKSMFMRSLYVEKNPK